MIQSAPALLTIADAQRVADCRGIDEAGTAKMVSDPSEMAAGP